MSCTSEGRTIELKIQAIDTINNQPRKNLKVELVKVKNPLFSMRSFVPIDTLRTDDSGLIKRKINEKGDYGVRFYRDDGITLIYWVDTLKIKDLKEDKFFKLSW